MTLRAAIYGRVSTDRQEFDTQVRILKEECARRGWLVAETYTEEESATKGEQPAFNRMMRDARLRKWDVLLFWAWDRVTRRGSRATLEIMNALDRAGVVYVSQTEPEASSQTEPILREFMAAFRGFLARTEAKRHSDRMKAWHSQKRALRQPHGRGGAKDKRPRTRRWKKRPATLDPPSTTLQNPPDNIGPIVAVHEPPTIRPDPLSESAGSVHRTVPLTPEG